VIVVRKKLTAALLLAIVSGFLPGDSGDPAPASGQEAQPPTVVAADTVWEGRVDVSAPTEVPAGVTLVIRPGTEVRFADGSGLDVEGILRAEGTAAQPIRFIAATSAPSPGAWAGIQLRGADDRSLLRRCVITHAASLAIWAGTPRVEDCEFRNGLKGIVVNGRETRPTLEGNRVADMLEGGIDSVNGASPTITGCTVERCGPFGVGASQGAAPLITRTTVSSCEVGIALVRVPPLLKDNTVRDNGVGIAFNQVNGGKPVEGNRVEKNKRGILCTNFSSPTISGNVVAENGEGIVCFMGARPRISGNDIVHNGTGVVGDQISSPELEANEIRDNEKGVYLTFSSYATIRGNNFAGNRVHIELGNMSADWERRAAGKPRRGLQRQLTVRAERTGMPSNQASGDGASLPDFVDARGNWWGEETTLEMEKKGPDANLAGLVDGYDVPVRVYEGFEGEYVQDKVMYAPWAKERIAGAGTGAR